MCGSVSGGRESVGSVLTVGVQDNMQFPTSAHPGFRYRVERGDWLVEEDFSFSWKRLPRLWVT